MGGNLPHHTHPCWGGGRFGDRCSFTIVVPTGPTVKSDAWVVLTNAMTTHTCQKCGGRIIFRPRVWHVKGKRIVVPWPAKAFPIHLDGPCGQMPLDLKLSA